MDNLHTQIAIIQESLQTIRLLGSINDETYKHLRALVLILLNELDRYEIKDDSTEVQKLVSFSEREKFVNEHIHLADTEVLATELSRRNEE